MAPGWPLLLFLLCALWLFRRSLLEGQVFFENDTLLFYYPLARLVDGALNQGKLPLWTPYIFAGYPLFADGEAGMLYPPNLVAYLLLPVGQAFVLLRVLRFFLAALFAYLYGRSLGLARPAASVVGLAFAYGSFMVGQIHHTNVGNTAIWLPLVLASVEWALRAGPRRRLVYLVLGAAALGSAALPVHANPLLMIALLVGLYVPFRLFVCRDMAPHGLGARLRRTVLMLALLLGIGPALGAVQLLPLWELGTFSRGQGIGYDFATGFATPPANVITLLFPFFFRDAADGYWSPWFRWDTTLYVGIAPLVLAVIAVLHARRRLTLFFAALAVVGLALALGDYLPVKLYALLWHLPGFSFLRGPGRFIYWTTFALAVLAGLGAQTLMHLLQAPGTGRGWRCWLNAGPPIPGLRNFLLALSLFTVAMAGALAAAQRWTELAPQAAKDLLQTSYLSLRGAGLERALARDPFEALRYSLSPTSPWTLRALLWLALTAVLLWAWYRWRGSARLWQSALIALVVVDLLAFAGHFHPTTTIESLQSAGAAGRFLQEHNGDHRVLTLWPVFDTWPNRLLPLRVAEAGGYSSLAPRRHEQFLRRASQGADRFLELLNVRYIVADRNRAPAWLQGGAPVFEEGGVAIFERSPGLPRAFVVHDVRVGTPAAVLAGLADPAFEPSQTAWLEEPLPPEAGLAVAAGSSTATAEVVADAGASVTVQAATAAPGLLVLGDSFYPGWQAYVDGERRPIYRANYLFRAVALPAGRHSVQFIFEPLTVRLGAGISLAAALCASLVLGLALWRQETTQPRTKA